MRSRLKLSLVILALAQHISSDGVAQEADSSQSDNPARKVYEQTAGAIVSITAQNEAGEDIRSGTGFLLSPEKHLRADVCKKRNERIKFSNEYDKVNEHLAIVVTNFHVIEGAVDVAISIDATSVERRLGSITLLPLRVEFEDRHADLALLSVSTSLVQQLDLSTSNPEVGDRVYAIGNPLALTGSLSEGIVSGIRTEQTTGVELIQTTAPISAGSSGSPLLDSDGRVVGVVTSTLSEGQNINFAVSRNDLVRGLNDPYYLRVKDRSRSLSDGTSIKSAKISATLMLVSTALGPVVSEPSGGLSFPFTNEPLLKAARAFQQDRFEDAAVLLEKATPPPNALGLFHWALGFARYNSALNEGYDTLAQFRRKESYTLAIESLEKSIEFEPDFVPALNLLCHLYQWNANWSRMLVTAQSLVIAARDCAKSYAHRGQAFYYLGDEESAIKDYRRGIRLNPKSRELYYYLGNAYRSTGKYDEAVAAYERHLVHQSDASLPADVRESIEESIEECRKLMRR